MFGRRNQRGHASQEEPQEPGHVEGPYEVDNFAWGHRTHGELKDLLNTRHQEGSDLEKEGWLASALRALLHSDSLSPPRFLQWAHNTRDGDTPSLTLLGVWTWAVPNFAKTEFYEVQAL